MTFDILFKHLLKDIRKNVVAVRIIFSNDNINKHGRNSGSQLLKLIQPFIFILLLLRDANYTTNMKRFFCTEDEKAKGN